MIAKNQPRLKTLGGNGVKLIIMKRRNKSLTRKLDLKMCIKDLVRFN